VPSYATGNQFQCPKHSKLEFVVNDWLVQFAAVSQALGLSSVHGQKLHGAGGTLVLVI
jgi:hypothetical protein